MDIENLQQIKNLLDKSKDIFIAADKEADIDSLAGGLSLYLSLISAGKNVTIASPTPPTVELASLVGINKLVNQFSGQKFIITLKDVIGRVEQVTYYTEGNELNLVIHSLAGAQNFTKDQVTFKESEPEAQLIFLIGVTDLNKLENLYTQDKEIYSKTPIISIQKDNRKLENSIAEIGYNNPSISETVCHLLATLELPINTDIAANLYKGIISATDNFQKPNVSAQTFEAAALCLRKKGTLVNQPEKAQTGSVNQIIQDKPKVDSDVDDNKDVEPQKDWFEPKIFRSSKNLQ
jgi:hypothetical protein